MTEDKNRFNKPEKENPEKHGFKKLSFGEDLKIRLESVKPSRWVRFSIVSLAFFLWVFWLGNPWVLFAWLLLLDIYILGYVPWNWWKRREGLTRTVMGWVDAIVYALVLVYFIFAFIGQNYTIPSSSLEKSLLVGDYLWVNKTVYGPRVPQTPLHFPLAQHTLPLVNTKSYIEKPQFEYHRLPGIRSIERGDIVVFNYPQGDTVCLKIQNPDYYMLLDELAGQGVEDPRSHIRSHPEIFGEVVWRPVDRRENYVKRAIGLPGERIRIEDDVVYINGQPMKNPELVQYNYIIPVKAPVSADKWKELGVRLEDAGATPFTDINTGQLFYDVPLTAEMKKKVESWPEVSGALVHEPSDSAGIFPTGAGLGWTRADMGEIWIPKRGSTLRLTLNNLPVYERAIRVYEGNDLEVKDGKIYINGAPADHYTFKMDYYWMMGDNRDRSADSRYWGFVPEDHVVGSPVFVIVSFDDDLGWTEGKVRWDRVLKSANPERGQWK